MKLLIFVLLLFSFTAQAQNALFAKYFEQQGAARYDYYLVGNSQSVVVSHQQSKYLPYWGGNPNFLIDTLNYGNFRYLLNDTESGELVFSKGFSPLFGEWIETNEAQTQSRSYLYSLIFPKPKTNLLLSIQQRSNKNEWQTIFTDTFEVDDIFIKHEVSALWDIDTLIYNGASSQNVDLAILAEGYSRSELTKFANDAQRLLDSLFCAAPFYAYRNSFNVFLVNAISAQSGTDIPGQGIFCNTAFNSSFYTFGSPRYLTSDDMKAVYDAVDGIGWDQLYLLVNHSMYGGGGFYNMLNVCSSDNQLSAFVFIHEFGHGFAGLADEYYSSATAVDDFHALDIEPWEPNITTLVNFDSKWKRMINDSIQIPTPRTEDFNGIIGVFEGGGYRAKGIYSPAKTCWMKEASAGAFCPVCQKAIEQVILTHTK
jgi:hypothetical protein